jgi:hypothetical protein
VLQFAANPKIASDFRRSRKPTDSAFKFRKLSALRLGE